MISLVADRYMNQELTDLLLLRWNIRGIRREGDLLHTKVQRHDVIPYEILETVAMQVKRFIIRVLFG